MFLQSGLYRTRAAAPGYALVVILHFNYIIASFAVGGFLLVVERLLTAPGRIDASEFRMPVTWMCYRVRAWPIMRSSAS
jgi:hypothetical protein